MKYLLPLGLLVLLTDLQAGEKVNLSPVWKSGSSHVQALEMVQVIGIPRHGEAKAVSHLEFGIRVGKETKFGGPALTLTPMVVKVNVDAPLPLSNVEFTSLKPEEGNTDVAAFYKSLQESPPILDLDGDGKTREVRGLTKLNQLGSVISQFLGKEQLSLFIQQGWLLEAPGKAVEVGASWPFQLKFPTPVGRLLIEGNYTFTGRKEVDGKSCAVIGIAGEVKGDFARAASKASGDPELQAIQLMLTAMGVKVKEGRMTGTIFHDIAGQRILSSEVDTRVRLSVEKYPENGKPTEIPIYQNLKLRMSEEK